MHPTLFFIGPIKIYSYGVMLGIAFLISAYLAWRRARLFNISEDFVNNLVLVLLISGIIGARILYVLLNLSYFRVYPLEALFIHRGGLVFYGGFILAFLAGMIFTGINRFSISDTADLMVPFLALGHAIGRLGCFLNGCCYGKPAANFLGVLFPGTAVKLYPTQLFSFAGLLLIFFILFYKQGRRRFKGQVLFLYLILYGLFRFFIEFLRGDLSPVFYNLTVTQIISILCAVVGLSLYLLKTKSQKI